MVIVSVGIAVCFFLLIAFARLFKRKWPRVGHGDDYFRTAEIRGYGDGYFRSSEIRTGTGP